MSLAGKSLMDESMYLTKSHKHLPVHRWVIDRGPSLKLLEMISFREEIIEI